MSVVSTIVAVIDDDADGSFRKHLESFVGTSQGQPFLLGLVPEECAGGYKVPECDLWWAAVNHLDFDGFVAHLAEGDPKASGMVVVHCMDIACVRVAWQQDGVR